MLNPVCPCAECGGRRNNRPNYGSLMRREEGGFGDEGGGRQNVDERGRDGLNSPCARILAFKIRTAICFRNGGQGEPTGREWQREHVRRSGPNGL